MEKKNKILKVIFGNYGYIFSLKNIKRRRGQTTIEYLLMLASVVSATLILVALFYKKLLGAVFTIVGLILGAGTPQK